MVSHGFWLVSIIFQGSFMVFGWFPWFFKVVSWILLVSMVLHGGFMVSHGFWLVSIIFQGSFMVSHGFWLVSMLFQGSFMVFHGLWLVSMVFQGSFNKKITFRINILRFL